MAWIESHQRLEKSWKLHRLSQLLKISPYQAIGHLHAFWWWGLDNAGPTGNIERFTPNEIGIAAGWDRHCDERIQDHDRGPREYPSPYAFCHALVTAGFIDVSRPNAKDADTPLGQGTKIHDWEEYTERFFDWMESIEKRRKSERLRQQRRRESVRIMSRTSERDSTRPNHTIPNHTIPNQTTTTLAVPKNGFEQLWEKYPNKDGRKAAVKHYAATVKTMINWLDIQCALDNYLIYVKDKDSQYIKNGSTWFNNWKDWVNYKGPEGGRYAGSTERKGGYIGTPSRVGKYAALGQPKNPGSKQPGGSDGPGEQMGAQPNPGNHGGPVLSHPVGEVPKPKA